MIVAFCGHSSYAKTEADEKRVLEILEHILENDTIEFFLGGYGEFDNFAYKCAQKFKKTHPHAKLIFVTPYIPAQTSQSHIEYNKNRFDLILYPNLEHIPPRYAISHRNKWMVEQADIVIAYITHRFGGAYTMYRHAKQKNKKIYNIAPALIDGNSTK